jgi:hypothetical protein
MTAVVNAAGMAYSQTIKFSNHCCCLCSSPLASMHSAAARHMPTLAAVAAAAATATATATAAATATATAAAVQARTHVDAKNI